MSRCVIVGGADIGDYIYIKDRLKEDDFCIFCDSGLRHLSALGVSPNLIVGDFDSHPNPLMDAETIVLPCEKDDTDTMYAVKEGIRRGFDEFLLIGVVGERFDHTFVNISILLYLEAQGKKGEIIDDYSEITLVCSEHDFVDDTYAYFSLLNVSGVAKGVSIENAKFPLDNAEITCEYQYGISNEVLKGKRAKIEVKEGKLLLVKIRKI